MSTPSSSGLIAPAPLVLYSTNTYLKFHTAAEAKEFLFSHENKNPDLFFSFSWTAKADGEAEIGLGYFINMRRYREYLSRNGAVR
jgi:hypothetical protein